MSTEPPITEPSPPRMRWLQAAATLSGATALGLALLYTAGLIARTGELVAAGFSPQEVLPLIPLQQGLARGVSLFIDPAVVFSVLAVSHAFVYQFFGPYRRALEETPAALPDPPSEDSRSPARFAIYAVLALFATAAVLFVNLATAPALIVLFALLTAVVWTAETSGRSLRRFYRPTILFAGLVWVLGQAYIGAAPLQRISISDSSRVVRGRLLASPGTQLGTWYVATQDDNIEAVTPAPSSTIRIYRDEDDKNSYPSSLFELIFR